MKIRNIIQREINNLIKESVNEGVYHKSFNSAIEYAISSVEAKGYEVDMEQVAHELGKHDRARPTYGETKSFSFAILKDGKPQRKMLQVQVYNMDKMGGSMERPYELNFYIN